jgi:hypothetical protein
METYDSHYFVSMSKILPYAQISPWLANKTFLNPVVMRFARHYRIYSGNAAFHAALPE